MEDKKKDSSTTNAVCVRTLGAVSQMCFLPLLHIFLGHPVTSSEPSVTEIFVRKVKITKKLFMWHVSWQEAHLLF